MGSKWRRHWWGCYGKKAKICGLSVLSRRILGLNNKHVAKKHPKVEQFRCNLRKTCMSLRMGSHQSFRVPLKWLNQRGEWAWQRCQERLAGMPAELRSHRKWSRGLQAIGPVAAVSGVLWLFCLEVLILLFPGLPGGLDLLAHWCVTWSVHWESQ